MWKFLKRLSLFASTTLLITGTVSAGTFYQSDENEPIVEGTTARADFQAAAGSLQQVDFDAFVEGQILTGNEFAAQGVTLQGLTYSGDPDDPLTPFPGFSRCISVNSSSGDIFVVDNTSTSDSGELEITFDTPSQAVGVTIMLDPEGGDQRLMEVYAPGGALIETSPLVIFDDVDGLSSAFVGWVGSGEQVAEKVIIGLDGDGMGYCSIEFDGGISGDSVDTEATPIPTMSIPGLALLAAVLSVFGFFGVRRRVGSNQ